MRDRRGFTLAEVMVALAIGALVLMLAREVYAGMAEATYRAAQARLGSDRLANGRRLLALLVGSARIGSEQDVFDGTPTRLVFSAWWIDQHGWRVRRRCQLSLSGDKLVLDGLSSEPLILLDSVRSGTFEYLPDRGERVPWLRGFQSQLLLPAALRVRIRRGERVDTLLLTTGERG
jgi:prepilin-type N-terminal cleavage/methylation domain-containing protein